MSRLVTIVVAAALALGASFVSAAPAFASDPFAACTGPNNVNPVVCENSKAGDPFSDWGVDGVGDSTIQGYATSMSINAGQTESFKIKSPSSSYHIDVLRLGYYNGDGARLIATNIKPTVTLPQSQPACLTDASTGLIDCGNWGVSASWAVPSNAVSGVYIAHLVRDDPQDPGGDSQIIFVVRNDSGHSGVLLQTSDETWQAYNSYGGNSLYQCTVACPPGNPMAYKAAYAVSYNRPFDGGPLDGGASYFWYAEYQMVRFLEQNGYDVSYTSASQVDGAGSLLKNHQLFMTTGHDEYWSGGQRTNVTAARDAGVNLAFFSGNEMFWKTRWAASSDGTNTPYRTVITYKETHFNAPTDPSDPSTWTGTWMDPRFSPPADGGQPSNSLTGQSFVVNTGSSDIVVPASYGKLRLWRNTAAAGLATGKSLTLGAGDNTLGYEWDVDADNGFRPAGLIDLSSTTVSGVQSFTDYGSTVADNQVATHHLTLYRAPSGALVFGAGTVQWAWGLDNTNAWNGPTTDPSQNPADTNMEQATVNLFADMGVQPATEKSGLASASASNDTTAPKSTITSPSSGASFQDGSAVTVSGTATDTGGGVVAGVEVSTNGGTTWHPATITSAASSTTWTYNWVAQGNPSTTLISRAVDDSGNLESPSARISVQVSCPCSLWGAGTPGGAADSGDGNPVTVGLKFKSDSFGTVNALRFYKVTADTGTHIGSLWTSAGTLLASATFSGETASGWQQVSLSNPVSINPNTAYVVSYFAPNGHYASSTDYFYPAPSPAPTGGGTINNAPLHAIPTQTSSNGVFAYGAGSTFPTGSFNASNYWVDVVFQPSAVPGQVTGVNATAGQASAQVSWSAPTSGGAVTTYTITPYTGGVAQPTTAVTGSPPATSATVTGLTGGKTYTFTVTASNPNGSGPASAQSNAVTPTAATPPTAPTGVTAAPATRQALVSWTPPASNGGSAITSYTVTPYIGTNAQTPVQVNSGSATSATVTGLTNGTAYTFVVGATNGVGSSPASSPSSAATPASTVFDFGTPANVDSGDGNAVSLGVKFKADVAGTVTGVRFYKAVTNTGSHVGSLWSASGTLLASATFAGEIASGWQTVTFSSPVTIAANTTYVVSYYAPQGHYSYNSSALGSPVDNAPLHTIANGVSGNGVYAYGANIFPTGSFNASNYWVDPMFLPLASPGQVTGVTATAGQASASLTWSPPSSGGASTTYTITPYIGTGAQATTTITGSPPATNATVTGLTGGSTYTFTVTASNVGGSGPPSANSNPVTPTTATPPSAPGNVSASPASSSALVNWTTPTSTGGSSITGYTVTPYIGSTAQTPLQVSGGSTTSATVSSLKNGTSYTFTVSATNGVGTGSASAASGAVTPENAIFDFATPGTVDTGDSSAVTLGVKFKADVPGSVTGIRFYKATANTGPHIGSLWSSSGALLASATSAGETPSGWQTVTFSNPVNTVPGATYIASYFAPAGHYSLNANGLSSSVDNAPLHAIGNSTSANGVYAYGSSNTFPNGSFNASNYWVDVLFAQNQSAAPPSAPGNVVASPATSSAQVSWSTPTTDGGSPITGYTVTPYIGASAQTPVQVSGATTTSVTLVGLTNGTAYTFKVIANNGVGSSPASAASSTVTPENTIFDFGTPATIDAGDSNSVTLGLKFTADVNGSIQGIRFYKSLANTGTHIGSLWGADGTPLASATFANETASGWQTVIFSTPIPVTAGTTYIASYFAPNGHYSVTSAGLNSAVDNPPLHSVANSVSANGIFVYGASSAFPNNSFNGSNYWVDVLFSTP